jgi:hypothetical protein
MTIAMALDAGTASLDKLYDVRQPLVAGTYSIKDPYPQGRPLSVRDIFLHSSNVGAGMLALEAGPERQRAFLARLGLTEPMRTEAGPIAPPLLPKHWGKVETVTIGLRPRPGPGTAAIRRRRGGTRQRWHEGNADAARQGRRPAASGRVSSPPPPVPGCGRSCAST